MNKIYNKAKWVFIYNDVEAFWRTVEAGELLRCCGHYRAIWQEPEQ